MPTSSKDWQKRYEVIRGLLAKAPIRSQADLCRALRAKGFRVTQSSVSRDLAELHAVKADGRYVLTESLAEPASSAPTLQRAAGDIVSVLPAGPHLLVVKTPPGRASAVGLAIDSAQWPDIVGTVAGDDTLFIALSGRRNQANIQARLAEASKKALP